MIRSFYSELVRQSGGDGRRSRFWLRAGISIGVLAALLWWLSTDVLFSAMARIPLPVWCLVVSGFILGHVVSAFKWRLLLHAVGVRVSGLDAVRAHGAGLFANLCLPSIIGGDVVRAGVIMRRHGNYEHIALASLADRINDSLALLLLAAVAATLVPADAVAAAGAALQVVASVLFAGLLTIIALICWFPAARLPERFARVLLRFRTGMDLLVRAPAIAALAFCLSLAIQGGFVLLNVLLAHAVGIEVPVVLWLFAWPLAKLIALAPISLGGIGVREVAIAGLMVPFGVDAALVVAQSLSWEVVLIGSGLLAGLLVAVVPTRTTEDEGAAV
jgi:uncharacterized protein (TIRG00374 family)